MQRLVANFVKNPAVAPAPNWPKYVPGNRTATLAKLAYDGNVGLGNVVQVAQSDSLVRKKSGPSFSCETHPTDRTDRAMRCGTSFWMSGFKEPLNFSGLRQHCYVTSNS